MHIKEAWPTIISYIDLIFKEQKLSYNNYLKLYSLVAEYCTSIDLEWKNEGMEIRNILKGNQLYLKLKEYLTSYCNYLLEKSADLTNEDLLQFYTTEWQKYKSSALCLHAGCDYLNRYWIKKSRTLKNVYRCEAALKICNLAIVIWKETLFNKYNTRLVDSAVTLINHQRQGNLIKTSIIQQLIVSYTSMGIYHDGETPSSSLYTDHFEERYLEMSDKFYVLEREEFLKNKSRTEYLEKVDKWLRDEADVISKYIDSSTQHKLVQILERSLIRTPLDDFLAEFREQLKLNRQVVLRMIYSLINRNPEDMNKFIDEFQKFVHSEGLYRIETCGEVIKSDAKLYANTILGVYQQYLSMISTIFDNNLKFKTALEKACSEFVNRNFATQKPNSTRKSSELITKYCDYLMKKSNSNSSNIDHDLEEIMILYRFITDKDVFREYYMKLLSKRLLSPEYYDENSEFLMISKLKTDSGVTYTAKLERMLRDVILSKEISEDFAQTNTEELKIDFNVMVLQYVSWPFRKSPQHTLPPELEKCVIQFTKYYSERYSGKKLWWMHNLSKGEIIGNNFKRRCRFQCSNMQIAILLLFNTSTTWSLTQLHEQTNIEMEFIVQIVQILLKVKIMTCENPKELTPESVISLNQCYNNKKYRININIPLKLETNQDREVSNKNIDQERKYLMQAKIVQIMKNRKNLIHQDLIAETLQELSSTFEPNISMIKRTIDQLVERDYLTHDETTNFYAYVA